MSASAGSRRYDFFAALRDREFGRLDQWNHVYVDYTGSALYGESQIRAQHALLSDGIFGNPHSESSAASATTELIDRARHGVLQFFDVDTSTHDVCFTANTTAAIKLVAESYPFTSDSLCLLSVDNHNSVNGIREYARRAGAAIEYVPIDGRLSLDVESVQTAHRTGLFAFPAQSNFSGVLHPLTLVAQAKARGLDVLVDIAAFAPSHAFSLRACAADFAVLSFYKLFGYPTGVGALIARRDALAKLRRPWFSGGTVDYASVKLDRHQLRPRHTAFEDGTPHFLGIAALEAGFALLEEAEMPRLTAHVERLTSIFLEGLATLPVRIYGPTDMNERGGTVAFNIDGIPYWEVEKQARDANVSLRGGCFCNPGASEVAFALDAGRMEKCFGAEDFRVERFASCLGTAVGAVRVSFGMANNEEDVRRALAVIGSVARRRPRRR